MSTTATISLKGLTSNFDPNEDRALALLDVNYNDTVYDWKIYVPNNVTSLESFLQSTSTIAFIQADIDAKEAAWTVLDPKTKQIPNIMNPSEMLTVPLLKEEIVKADVPDYYAKRRIEYPRISDQVGAFWKGPGSTDYVTISQEIEEVKARYPKAHRTPAEAARDLVESIVNSTQARLDTFARTRNYDGILSACTYVSSPVPKFQAEGQYCVQARDTTWATLYQILAEVEAGTRPAPTSFSDIESLLPPLAWPN